MTFKSAEQPRCRWCGKAIAKDTYRVHAPTEKNTLKPVLDWRYDGNQQIVSREYTHLLVSPDGKDWIGMNKARPGGASNDYYREQGWQYEKRLRCIGVWDGESYVDPFFCSGDHAKQFGYSAARQGLGMPAYHKAIRSKDAA